MIMSSELLAADSDEGSIPILLTETVISDTVLTEKE